jgi:formate/nitrite transporter FocA (FNT family)
MNEVNFFPPSQIAQKSCEAGVGKCKLPLSRMFLLAVLAGAFIAFVSSCEF